MERINHQKKSNKQSKHELRHTASKRTVFDKAAMKTSVSARFYKRKKLLGLNKYGLTEKCPEK